MVGRNLRTLANTQCIQTTHYARNAKHQYEAIKENNNEYVKDHSFRPSLYSAVAIDASTTSTREPAARLRTDATEDGLRLEVGREPENAVFAADARLLESAEGYRRIVRRAVDDDTPGLDLIRHRRGPVRVGGDHISLQPIGRVVGDRDRIRLVLIGQHAQHGAENLFPGDRHIIGDD